MNYDEKKAAELFEAWRPWLEWRATVESTPNYSCDWSAIKSAPSFVRHDEEEAFRRGYWHGYSQALDDIEAAGGLTAAWSRVAKFFDGALSRWRYHGGQVDVPPTFDPKA